MTPKQTALLVAFSKLLRAATDALDEAAKIPAHASTNDETNPGGGPEGGGPGEGPGGPP